jgi:hypothetical protein
MPKANDLQLRGFMAQVARATKTSLDNVSRFEINKLLRARGFDPLTGTEMAPIKEALKKGPYPTHGPGKLTLYSFEYWFNYFYAELPADQKLVLALNVINDDGTLRTEDQIPNKIGLFHNMLRLGFRQFLAADYLTAEQMQVHAAGDNPLQNTVNILFRGDSRAPEQIRTQGTMPQTQVAFLRETRGMTKPWHPFLAAGNSVWVRNGEVNKDNCLFSAVSVTPQFYVATKFPLLDGLMGESPEQVGYALVRVRDAVAAPVRPALSTFQSARQAFASPAPARAERNLKLRASRTSIYGVVMRGGYNTQKYQLDAPFPEYASENLTWGDHLVYFSVTRIHYGLGGNDGHLIIINDHRFLQDPEVIRAALMGPRSLGALQSFVADIVRRGSLHAGVGGIVYTPPGVQPPFEIVRVQESFMPV